MLAAESALAASVLHLLTTFSVSRSVTIWNSAASRATHCGSLDACTTQSHVVPKTRTGSNLQQEIRPTTIVPLGPAQALQPLHPAQFGPPKAAAVIFSLPGQQTSQGGDGIDEPPIDNLSQIRNHPTPSGQQLP